MKLEKQLHKRFDVQNLEWFHHTKELCDFINDNNESMLGVEWLGDKILPFQKMKIV